MFGFRLIPNESSFFKEGRPAEDTLLMCIYISSVITITQLTVVTLK